MSAINCPYCNTPVFEDASTCPRCGERINDALDGPLSVTEMSKATYPPTEQSSSLTRPFVIIAGLGFLGVVVGVIYAYMIREPIDPSVPREVVETEVVPEEIPAPQDWAGLDRLPPDCNVVLGVRPRQWVARFASGETFESIPEVVLQIEKVLGVRVRELEEVLIGMRVGAGVPEWQAVLTSSRDFDVASLTVRAAGTVRLPKSGERVLRLRDARTNTVAFVRVATPRTLLVADSAERLDETRGAPPAKLGSLIETKLSSEALAWVVADTSGWDKHILPRTLASELIPNLTPESMAQVNRFTVAVEKQNVETPPVVAMWFVLEDARSAGEFQAFLKARIGDISGLESTTGGSGVEVYIRGQGKFEALRTAWRRVSAQ